MRAAVEVDAVCMFGAPQEVRAGCSRMDVWSGATLGSQ